ncbi:MAG: sulfite exporter TauE/SafE family protein [Actinomycetota bacterium]
MSWPQALLVLVAGIAAGTINTVVGSGTLITFPVLLTIGLSPLSANISNTVGLAPGSIVGAIGYRNELSGQLPRAIRLGVGSGLGGLLGAVLLLVLPDNAFEAVVPALVALGIALVVLGPYISRRLEAAQRYPGADVTAPMWAATFGVGIYGGYFGAAQGVLLVGILGMLLAESLQRINALKNVLAGVANGIAALVFAPTPHLNWAVAGLIAAGSMAGAVIGARVGRRLPPNVLRAVIVIVGLVALGKLLLG